MCRIIAILLLLTLSSCSAQKRAARLLDKAARLDPAIIQIDTVKKLVKVTTPRIEGVLTGRNFSDAALNIFATDSNIAIRISGDYTAPRIDYAVLPQEIQAEAEVAIQRYKPTKSPIWPYILVGAGIVLLGLWLVRK